MEVLQALTWCRRNAPNYQENHDSWKTLPDSSQCLKYVVKDSWVSWILVTWLWNYKLLNFERFTQVVVISEGRTELSIKWRISGDLFFINKLAFDNSLIKMRENYCLLRIIWGFSESVSECLSVFQICVWIIIHVFLTQNKLLTYAWCIHFLLWLLLRRNHRSFGY